MRSDQDQVNEEFGGFSINQINPKKIHLAFENYKQIATYNFFGIINNLKEEAERRSTFVEFVKGDINLFLDIQNKINEICTIKEKIVDSINSKPTIIESKRRKLLNKGSKSLVSGLKENNGSKFEDLHNQRLISEKEMSEILLKKSYDKLAKMKDEFEIVCVKSFTSLIMNIKDPTPKEIERTMRKYPTFY